MEAMDTRGNKKPQKIIEPVWLYLTTVAIDTRGTRGNKKPEKIIIIKFFDTRGTIRKLVLKIKTEPIQLLL